MKQKRTVIVIAIVVAVIVIGVVGFLYFYKTLSTKNAISGTVINVTDRPNIAEDGYYGFDVQTSSGQKYTVNATGYLNTPLTPDEHGEACLYMPKVKVGDKVEFNLPTSEGQQDTFVICHAMSTAGYYFKLN